MTLKVLGSSSYGNCYILETESEALIVEAGIGIKAVKQALGFNIRKVVGCLVTHEHNDHAGHIKEMIDCGFYTLALPEVWAAKGIEDSRAVSIAPGKGYCLGGFKVYAFAAFHDVPCVGYMIDHEECGRIMFLTDSYQCDVRFRGLSHVLIECNYSLTKLYDSISKGVTHQFQTKRLEVSHMELSDCKEVLVTTDLSKVMNIVLIHLSDSNSDEEYFVREIQRATGKTVYAAYPGLTLNLNKL